MLISRREGVLTVESTTQLPGGVKFEMQLSGNEENFSVITWLDIGGHETILVDLATVE